MLDRRKNISAEPQLSEKAKDNATVVEGQCAHAGEEGAFPRIAENFCERDVSRRERKVATHMRA